MAFNFLKKLFRKNKSTIEMTPEEAYGAIAPEEEKPVREDMANEPQEEAPARSCRTELFTCLEDPDAAATKIRSVMSDAFISVTETEEGYSGLLTENVRASVKFRVDSDCQLGTDLRNEYESASLPDTDVLGAALMQMSMFNVKLTLVSSGDEEKTDSAHAALVCRLAAALKGFYRKEGSLYRWDGKLLVDLEGKTDFTVFMPVRCTSASESAEADPSALRKMHSVTLLESKGISSPCDAPAQMNENNLDLRPAEDVVGRAAALLLVSLTAMAYTSPAEFAAPAAWCAALTEKLDKQFAVRSFLTAKEKSYLARPTPDKHEGFLMNGEACRLLLWCIGLQDDPGWPDQKIDLKKLSEQFKSGSYSLMVKQARYKENAEYADAHDLICRLHYATVFSPAEELQKAQVDADIVYERHYALNWFLGTDGITSWDNIIPRM